MTIDAFRVGATDATTLIQRYNAVSSRQVTIQTLTPAQASAYGCEMFAGVYGGWHHCDIVQPSDTAKSDCSQRISCN